MNALRLPDNIFADKETEKRLHVIVNKSGPRQCNLKSLVLKSSYQAL